MFVNMLLNKDRILIKNLYVLKGYIAQELLKKIKVRAGVTKVFGSYDFQNMVSKSYKDRFKLL